MKLSLAGGVIAVLLLIAAIVGYSTLFTVNQTKQALVVRLGQPVRVITQPGLNVKIPFIDNVIYVDKRILDLESPAQEVIASDQKRLVVDAFARYRITDPLRFYQTVGEAGASSQLAIPAQLSAAQRARRRHAGRRGAQHARATDVAGARRPRSRGAAVRHSSRRRAHPPRRSAGAEQPSGLPAHANRAAARSSRIPRPRQPEEPGNSRQGRPRRHRALGGRNVPAEQIRGQGDSERNRIFADAYNRDPGFFAFYRSMQAYEKSMQHGDTRLVLRPDSDFFRYFSDPAGRATPNTPSTPSSQPPAAAHPSAAK